MRSGVRRFRAGRAQIEKPTAADRALGRRIAQDEAITRRGGDRPLEHQLHVAPASPGAIGSSPSRTMRAPTSAAA